MIKRLNLCENPWASIKDKKIEDKINELVAFANSSEKSTKEQINESIKKNCSTCRAFDRCSWDGKYTGTTHCKDWIEPITEKMYTLDEVAEMFCFLTDNEAPCNYSHLAHKCNDDENFVCSYGRIKATREKVPLACWKHAIQNGWLKGE